MLKKIFNLLIVVVIVFSFTACGETMSEVPPVNNEGYKLSLSETNYVGYFDKDITDEQFIMLDINFTYNGAPADLSLLKITSKSPYVVKAGKNGKIILKGIGSGIIWVEFDQLDLLIEANVTVKAKPKKAIDTENDRYSFVLGEGGFISANINAKAYYGNSVDNNAVITYDILDDSVASVDKNGLITANKHGKTVCKVSYDDVIKEVEIFVFDKLVENAINTQMASSVNTYGRTWMEGGSVAIANVASGIEVSFYGTELKASIRLEQSNKCYFRVFIDGKNYGAFMSISAGLNQVVLAENLKLGAHTVKICKSSECNEGIMVFEEFLDNIFLKPQEKPNLTIEFIGDSITAGYAVLSTGEGRSIDNSDGCSTYAFKACQNLGAEISVIALQGIALKAYPNWKDLNMNALYKQKTYYDISTYDFSDQVDVVVINIGTNDNFYLNNHPEYAEQFSKDYKDFLAFVRSVRPNAYIVCMIGTTTVSGTITNGIIQAVEQMNDDKISAKVSGWNTHNVAGVHPGVESSMANGQILAEYINNLMSNK